MAGTTVKTWDLDGISVHDLLTEMGRKQVESISWREEIVRNQEAKMWVVEAEDLAEGLGTSRSPRIRQLRRLLSERWAKPNSLRQSSRVAMELYLRQRDITSYLEEGPLCIDHTRTWNQGGKMLCVTTEPYNLELGPLTDVDNLCAKKGLAAYVHYGAEVHYPGVCFSIVAMKAGDEVRIPTLYAAIQGWRERAKAYNN